MGLTDHAGHYLGEEQNDAPSPRLKDLEQYQFWPRGVAAESDM